MNLVTVINSYIPKTFFKCLRGPGR